MKKGRKDGRKGVDVEGGKEGKKEGEEGNREVMTEGKGLEKSKEGRRKE